MPDVANAWDNDRTAWILYLAICQVRNAAFCLLAIWVPKDWSTRILLYASAAWYVGQSIDEGWFGNTFHDGLWEYPALALYAWVIHRHIKHHEPQGMAGT